MIVHKNIHDSALPLYEVEEVSMTEALDLLDSQRHREETLISRAGNKLRLLDSQQSYVIHSLSA